MNINVAELLNGNYILLLFVRSEEHTSELQSPEAISYAVSGLLGALLSPLALSYTHLDVYKRQDNG